ncbi:MAG: hypothetical protein AABZ47_07135 [Planctomycetota bacterium]
MIRCKFLGRCLAALFVGVIWTSAYSEDSAKTTNTVQLDGNDYNVVLMDDVFQGDAVALPDNLTLQRVFVGKNGVPVTAGSTGVEVYRNVLGPIYSPGGVNGLIADDVQTTAANGCDMSYLEIAVFGGGNGTGPGFNVTQLKIFDRCPGQAGAVVLVDLLDGTPLSLPNNAGFLLTFDLELEVVSIPSDFWLGMAFSTAQAGWIGGASPTIGTSLNVIDVPTIRCNAVFSNPALYASMYADVFCATAETFFVGYKSEAPSGIFFGGGGCTSPATLGGCGDGINVNVNCEAGADDINPTVPNCQLRGYTVNVAGLGGAYDIEFELWTDDDSVADTGAPLAPIPGTRGCYHGAGNGFLEQAAFVFDGSVVLPPKFWLVWADNNLDAGPIESAALAEIGFSGDFFAIFDRGENPPAWDPNFFFNGCTDGDGDECGSFHITVQCLGVEPTGACCSGAGGTCSDNRLIGECGGGRWQPNVTCAAALFNPPCGTTACCKVDPNDSNQTVCDNVNPVLCVADGGDSTPGQFCATVECGFPGCIAAEGSCLTDHGTPGCMNNECCNLVCDVDPFCCNNMWDDTCVGTAEQVCPPQPPANDNREDAIEIQLGSTPFSTLSTTTDGPALPQSCSSGGSVTLGHDIWYEFNAQSTGLLTIDLCTGTDYDSRIAVYDSCIGAPNMVVSCDDDGCDPDPGTDPGIFTSISMLPVSAGQCYLLRVGGFGLGESGTGTIMMSENTEACPTSGSVAYVDPPSGVVDARQPHPVSSTTPRQGIRTFNVNAPTASNPIMCFELCETDDEGAPNTILTVLDPPGSYDITFTRTISVGAVSTLNYTGTNATGTFTSHPGNVNGNAVAGADDVLSLMNCLQGSIPSVDCPFGLYSADIDQNGARSVLDLARLLDVLNGAGALTPWNNTQKPASAGCP